MTQAATELTTEKKLEMAMALLRKTSGYFDEAAPYPTWFEEYFAITGDHMHLTEYGWIPADQNTREVTGEEPMEVLKEVNVPA